MSKTPIEIVAEALPSGMELILDDDRLVATWHGFQIDARHPEVLEHNPFLSRNSALSTEEMLADPDLGFSEAYKRHLKICLLAEHALADAVGEGSSEDAKKWRADRERREREHDVVRAEQRLEEARSYLDALEAGDE